jgi:hypothetical protein
MYETKMNRSQTIQSTKADVRSSKPKIVGRKPVPPAAPSLAERLKQKFVFVDLVTTGPLERSTCRVHLPGRCRDLLTDAVLTPGLQMHPVEEDGRFVNQPVYPDRQPVFCLRERSTKEKNLLFQGQVKKCEVPCRFRPASTIFRKLD